MTLLYEHTPMQISDVFNPLFHFFATLFASNHSFYMRSCPEILFVSKWRSFTIIRTQTKWVGFNDWWLFNTFYLFLSFLFVLIRKIYIKMEQFILTFCYYWVNILYLFSSFKVNILVSGNFIYSLKGLQKQGSLIQNTLI